MSNGIAEVTESGASRAPKREVISPERQAELKTIEEHKRKELPDASTVDPWKIPYGEFVQTKQGRVCSARPAPDYRPQDDRGIALR